MKSVVLIPVKNEDWILEYTLRNIAHYVDIVIIADQNSTDGTLEICKKFSNVQVIKNEATGHSNEVRWLLLEEARKFGKNNLIICIDADEIISPAAVELMKRKAESGEAVPGDVFRFKWVQLWKDVRHYRDDGVWRNNFKNIAFVDNPGVNEYRKHFVINDHTSRSPDTNIGKEILTQYPLLHFHFLPWQRNQMKQAWYRCTELIKGERTAKAINASYRITLPSQNIKSTPTPKEWFAGLNYPENFNDVVSKWHLDEILGFFKKHGIEFFEQLEIWHIKELHDQFVREKGREPVSQTYPKWLILLNDIKNRLKNVRF